MKITIRLIIITIIIVLIPMLITVYLVNSNFKQQSYEEVDLKIKNTMQEVVNQFDDLKLNYIKKVKAFASSREIALPTYMLQKYGSYFDRSVREQLQDSIANSSLLFNLALNFDVVKVRSFEGNNKTIIAIENQQRVVKKFIPDSNVIKTYKGEKVFFLDDSDRLTLHAQAPIMWKDQKVGILILKKFITREYLKNLQTAQGVNISIVTGGKSLISTISQTSSLPSNFFKQNGTQDKIIRGVNIKGEPYNFAYHTFPLKEEESGKVLVGFSTESTQQKIFDTKLIIFKITFYTLLLAIILIIFMSNKFTKPIKKMSEVTNEIVQGNLDKQVDYQSNDEFGELVRNFNQMVSYYKQSRDNLYQMKEFQENILESIKEGMVVIDYDCKIQSLNYSMTELFQISKENYIEKSLYELPPFIEFDQDFWQTIEKEGSFVMNDFSYQASDRTYVFNLRIYPLRNRENNIYGAVIILEDISKKTELEKQILLNDKLTSIGRFTAGIAHEINNPLGTIVNYTETLLYDEEDESRQDYLKRIKIETERISSIVQGLLNFSSQSKSEFGIINIKEVIELSLQICQYQEDYNKFEIRKDFPENIPYIMGNFNQLQQVCINIILNAFESMQEGDILTIDINTSKDRSYLKVMFIDTGPGIKPEYINNIFDPFFTTKDEQGVGLGLSTSYGIIKNHGGDIIVDSEVGEGSKFIIQLPVYNYNQNKDM